jgi:large subunit ribosomal protein L37Ae
MTKTKKVGTTGRFGPRYGRKTRKIIAKIEKDQRGKKECPYCERSALKRVVTGIWSCKKCKVKFAGGAYFPTTPIGEAFERQMKTGILRKEENE